MPEDANKLDTASRLGRIEGKLEILLETSSARDGRYDKQGGRIDVIEKKQAGLIGYATGASAGVATVIAFLSHMFEKGV